MTKLWAKRGKWRICEIIQVSPAQIAIELGAVKRRGEMLVGVPYCYAQIGRERIYIPRPANNIEIEESDE
jgi:hypothetical protein